MKSAFGIKLTVARDIYNQPVLNSDGAVMFWKDEQGWCGCLQVAGINISETIGSASPEACYRSLRGRARNLMRGLKKLGVKP